MPARVSFCLVVPVATKGTCSASRALATRRMPRASPVHQVIAMAPIRLAAIAPVTNRLATAIPALANGATKAAETKPSVRARGKWPALIVVRRERIQQPISPSRLLPMAMGMAVRKPPVRALAAKAPSRMAGHNRGPKATNMATARPDAGQTGEALFCKVANSNPSLATTK